MPAKLQKSRIRLVAFTLIEILVVIAVLAILAALLVPVGRQAVTAANRMKSASQMKQIGQALHGTAADLNGFLPSISGNDGLTNALGVWNRCEAFATQLPRRQDDKPNVIFVAPQNNYGLPTERISSTYSAGGVLHGFRADLATPTLTKGARRSLLQIHSPTTAVLLFEGVKIPGNTYCETAVSINAFKADMQKEHPGETAAIDFRYGERSNVLFADGHIQAFSLDEMKKEISPEEYAGCSSEPAGF